MGNIAGRLSVGQRRHGLEEHPHLFHTRRPAGQRYRWRRRADPAQPGAGAVGTRTPGRGRRAGRLAARRRTHASDRRRSMQISSQIAGRDAPIEMPADRLCSVRCGSGSAPIRPTSTWSLNLAYDWLPIYLTPFLDVARRPPRLDGVAERRDGRGDRRARRRPTGQRRGAQPSAGRDVPGDRRPGCASIGNGIAVERYDVHLTADEPRVPRLRRSHLAGEGHRRRVRRCRRRPACR